MLKHLLEKILHAPLLQTMIYQHKLQHQIHFRSMIRPNKQLFCHNTADLRLWLTLDFSIQFIWKIKHENIRKKGGNCYVNALFPIKIRFITYHHNHYVSFCDLLTQWVWAAQIYIFKWRGKKSCMPNSIFEGPIPPVLFCLFFALQSIFLLFENPIKSPNFEQFLANRWLQVFNGGCHSYQFCLLWQKEASDIPSKSELSMFFFFFPVCSSSRQILCI